ncbi:MAG: cyclodeaminase/cyclohydrolase family protein [Chloroflexi bacterium]|nr:cyclodeaminase/cyclohydrolase family protein [Chloroflexota bacterium]
MNHPDSSSIFDLKLGDFLERLGSSDPTPGGGAAAAVVGALGAALIEMTANLTVGRPRLADVQDQAHSIVQRAAELRARLQKLGDADAEAFDQVTAAYRLPRADDDQKAARARAIQSALRLAADVPLETARISASVVALAEEAAPVLNRAVISDVLVGALVARAALNSAALNVEINLGSMTDSSTIEHYSAELTRARQGVDERVERTLAAGRSRFPGQ